MMVGLKNTKRRLGPQMIAGFMLMSGIVVLLSVFAIFYTNRMQHNNSRILEENVASLKAAEELEISLLEMRGLTTNYLLDGHQDWLETFDKKRLTFQTWLALASRRSTTATERTLVDSIAASFQNYLASQRLVVALHQTGRKKAARELLTGAMQTRFTHIYDLCEKLLAVNEQMMHQTSLLIKKDNQTINRVVLGIALSSIVLGLGLGLILSRRIIKPIYRLVLNVKGATEGKMVNKVELSNESELDNLSHNIHLLIKKIQTVNADLAKSQQSLIRSEKLAALGKMAAGLAHEIRNPLTSIKMLIFSLENELADQSHYRKDLEVIRQEINRLETLLQNFLDFARPQQPQLVPLRLHDSLKRVIHLMAPQLKKHKIKLALKLQATNDWVKADKDQIQHVLVNIILNALQAMPGGGVLTIATDSLINDDGLPFFQMCISDTGCGISPDIIDFIFDPFITNKEDGSGLGLSIVHQIITAHSGWIEAANNPDRGATFTINLPQEKLDV